MNIENVQFIYIPFKSDTHNSYYVFFLYDKELQTPEQLINEIELIPAFLEIVYNTRYLTAYIASIYVKEEYRHKGYATAMLKKSIENAKIYAMSRIETDEVDVRCCKNNLFSRLGFKRVQCGSPEMALKL